MSSPETEIAVVTGASQGIGRAIARRLARGGTHVVLAARDETALRRTRDIIHENGGESSVATVDVADEASVQSLADTTLTTFGRVDVLVNNSGAAGPSAPLWEQKLSGWRETFRVNVDGVFLCCRAFLPAMIRHRRGCIVNIGSVTGKRPLAERSPYAASKLALLGLTRTLALEAGPHGVRVNQVSPGAVDGERLQWVLENIARAQGITTAEARTGLEAQSALRRLVLPSEVAETVAFLASSAAASITGEDIDVNAGLAMF